MNRQATEIRVNGIVQGVGFRPFVYRLATQHGLVGFITNNSSGVVIRIAGDEGRIESLIRSLREEAPPLARIISLVRSETALPVDTAGFTILASETGPEISTHVSPDMATCEECRREILDPADRRYGYPFTNCTNCGPRYTIIRTLPYDRPATTMHGFTMCPECLAEYRDPANRRFHAQPNACGRCGPRLHWYDGNGSLTALDHPLAAAADALQKGLIVGIKGLGGFHLAVDAFSREAVAELRNRKNRPCKPLAVMAGDLAAAHRICLISPREEQQLTAFTLPITLLTKRPASRLADNLAPGIDELGVMLPYTPLHQLLFAHEATPACLVMTSGNAAGEPLCRDNEEAVRRLSSFCDGFLMHDRDIHTRVDDSVIRIIGDKPRFLRRSRGYAPAPVRLEVDLPPLLAVGAELKNCFCLTRRRDAFLSQHIGDLNDLATLEFFEETCNRLKALLEIEPRYVAADLHPDYLSTRFALELGLPVIRIQHHWAHAASVMAEHGLPEALAIILDGTGYGPDRTIWGGEVLHCTFADYQRLGRLSPLRLPGGDMAARQPWRMALAALHSAGINDSRSSRHLERIPAADRNFILDMLAGEINSPPTSSCGRLFDAVSSLLGICHVNTFEGQAAMILESRAAAILGGGSIINTGFFADLAKMQLFQQEGILLEVSTDLCIRSIINKMEKDNQPVDLLALFFHVFLVSAFGNMILYLSGRTGIKTVVLSGGSAQNRILVQGFLDFFARTDLEIFTNEQVPANDGGLALGQAVTGGIQCV
ncbi:MAG: carbamoyltransferase HypF [Desulfobulbaceae bacterium]|nr:carbamoyltransferase HypF [Desulfobulbaceae bacterium]